MEHGAFAGYPMSSGSSCMTARNTLLNSKPIAFETAGREAFKLAVEQAGPVLFEPIMNVRITVPDAIWAM